VRATPYFPLPKRGDGLWRALSPILGAIEWLAAGSQPPRAACVFPGWSSLLPFAFKPLIRNPVALDPEGSTHPFRSETVNRLEHRVPVFREPVTAL
jgi:hypothetical protein